MKTKRIQQFFRLFAFIFSIFLVSCGKHIYRMKYNELARYAKSAREPGLESFVVYGAYNGSVDTLKGRYLDWKRKNGSKRWYMDGKEITMNGVENYQDRYAYYEQGFVRITKGKLNLYYHQVSTPGSMTMKTVGSTTTTFYMGERGEMQAITLNSLKSKMMSCKQAIQKIDEEFGKTYWKKHPDLYINDYRALLRIFTVYNSCN